MMASLSPRPGLAGSLVRIDSNPPLALVVARLCVFLLAPCLAPAALSLEPVDTVGTTDRRRAEKVPHPVKLYIQAVIALAGPVPVAAVLARSDSSNLGKRCFAAEDRYVVSDPRFIVG